MISVALIILYMYSTTVAAQIEFIQQRVRQYLPPLTEGGTGKHTRCTDGCSIDGFTMNYHYV